MTEEEKKWDRACLKCGRTYHKDTVLVYCVCGSELVEKNEDDESLMHKLARL